MLDAATDHTFQLVPFSSTTSRTAICGSSRSRNTLQSAYSRSLQTNPSGRVFEREIDRFIAPKSGETAPSGQLKTVDYGPFSVQQIIDRLSANPLRRANPQVSVKVRVTGVGVERRKSVGQPGRQSVLWLGRFGRLYSCPLELLRQTNL